MNWDRLVRQLKARRLIDAHVAPEPPQASATAPWSTQVLSVFGAWLATFFLLGFLGFAMAGWLSSWGARLAVGVAMAGAAAFASRRSAGASRPTAFWSQFVSAVGFAGFALAVSGTADAGSDSLRDATWYASAGVFWSLVLGRANVDPMHRIVMAWSTVACAVALLMSVDAVQAAVVLLALLATALWLTQTSWVLAPVGPRVSAIAHAASTAALAVSLQPAPFWFVDLGRAAGPAAVPWSPWTTLGVFLALVGAVLLLSERWWARRSLLIGALAGLLLVAFGSVRMPGVSMCMLLWVLGTAAGRPVLRGMALAGLPVGVFLLYFDLSSSLLAKGVSLLAVGAILAGAGVLLRLTAVRSDDA